MDVHSIEFYVLALFVAFALLGVIFGRTERAPARSHLQSYDLDVAEPQADDEHFLRLRTAGDGLVAIERTGLELRPAETVNLVVTIIDDKATIIEKRGVESDDGEARPRTARAEVDWLPARRLHIRYESEITGEWGTLTFAATPQARKECRLHR